MMLHSVCSMYRPWLYDGTTTLIFGKLVALFVMGVVPPFYKYAVAGRARAACWRRKRQARPASRPPKSHIIELSGKLKAMGLNVMTTTPLRNIARKPCRQARSC